MQGQAEAGDERRSEVLSQSVHEEVRGEEPQGWPPRDVVWTLETATPRTSQEDVASLLWITSSWVP